MAKMRVQNYVVHGVTGFVCRARIEKALRALPGVSDVKIHKIKNTMSVTFDEEQCSNADIIKTLQKVGCFEAIPVAESWQLNVQDLPVDHQLKRRLLGSAVLTLLIALLSLGPRWGINLIALAEANTQFQLGLCIFVMALHYHCYVRGFKNFIHLTPEVNTLLFLGTLAAFIFSCLNLMRIPQGFLTVDLPHNFTIYFDMVAGILTLASLGQYLENRAKFKLVCSLTHLYELAPKTVLRRRVVGKNLDGEALYEKEEISIADIKVGDVLIARSGTKIGADGIVVEGTGYFDERELSGHLYLQRKILGSKVSCGSFLKHGYIAYKVIRVGADTTLSQIISLLDDTNSQHSAISRAADKLAFFLVPLVIVLALATFYIWLEVGAPLPHAVSYAVAVLLVSCPGAISLAAPTAIALATTRAVNFGIMIKNPEALENLSQLDIFVFDKTGIITKGNYRVAHLDVQDDVGVSTMELLYIVRLLEEPYDQVLSRSVLLYIDEVRSRLLQASTKAIREKIKSLNHAFTVTDCEFKKGLGVSGKINGQQYYFGSSHYAMHVIKSLRNKQDFLTRYENHGFTTLHLFNDEKILASFALYDEINQDAPHVVALFNQMHIRSVLVSGDSYKVVEQVAKSVNIDTFRAWYLPQDKRAFISGLEKNEYYVGVVDAGSDESDKARLSDVGITMASNPDLKHSNADVVLMHNHLIDLIPAVLLSKVVLKNIKQNVILALGSNLIFLPLAAGCLSGLGIVFNPMLAIALNFLSSLAVILNALRLKKLPLRYKTKDNVVVSINEQQQLSVSDGRTIESSMSTLSSEGGLSRSSTQAGSSHLSKTKLAQATPEAQGKTTPENQGKTAQGNKACLLGSSSHVQSFLASSSKSGAQSSDLANKPAHTQAEAQAQSLQAQTQAQSQSQAAGQDKTLSQAQDEGKSQAQSLSQAQAQSQGKGQNPGDVAAQGEIEQVNADELDDDIDLEAENAEELSLLSARFEQSTEEFKVDSNIELPSLLSSSEYENHVTSQIESTQGNILSGDDPRFAKAGADSSLSLSELNEWYQKHKDQELQSLEGLSSIPEKNTASQGPHGVLAFTHAKAQNHATSHAHAKASSHAQPQTQAHGPVQSLKAGSQGAESGTANMLNVLNELETAPENTSENAPQPTSEGALQQPHQSNLKGKAGAQPQERPRLTYIACSDKHSGNSKHDKDGHERPSFATAELGYDNSFYSVIIQSPTNELEQPLSPDVSDEAWHKDKSNSENSTGLNGFIQAEPAVTLSPRMVANQILKEEYDADTKDSSSKMTSAERMYVNELLREVTYSMALDEAGHAHSHWPEGDMNEGDINYGEKHEVKITLEAGPAPELENKSEPEAKS